MPDVHNQASGTVFGDVVQAGRIDHVILDVPPRPVMSGLPADVAGFVGREGALAEVASLLGGRGPVVVSGPPGVGKTAVLLRAAHDAVDGGRFPGGVLFADLRGYDNAPADPAETLAAFLRALGLPDDQVPFEQGERETTYRSLLAHRGADADAGAVLVVLDNASSAAQVRPLLPGAGAHRVLVTSRHWLGDLDDVQPVGLDVLSVDESVSLLARGGTSVDRLSREPEAAGEMPHCAADFLWRCGSSPR